MINNIGTYTGTQPTYKKETAAREKGGVANFTLPGAETETTEQPEEKDLTAMEKIAAYKAELFERIKNNDTDPKFMIGSAEYSVKEWDKLMSQIDKAEEALEAEMEERKERLAEEEMQKKIAQLFEDRSETQE